MKTGLTLTVIGILLLLLSARLAVPAPPTVRFYYLPPSRPFLEFADGKKLYVHKGWTVRCISVDGSTGVVEPNYKLPSCWPQQRITNNIIFTDKEPK